MFWNIALINGEISFVSFTEWIHTILPLYSRKFLRHFQRDKRYHYHRAFTEDNFARTFRKSFDNPFIKLIFIFTGGVPVAMHPTRIAQKSRYRCNHIWVNRVIIEVSMCMCTLCRDILLFSRSSFQLCALYILQINNRFKDRKIVIDILIRLTKIKGCNTTSKNYVTRCSSINHLTLPNKQSKK